MVQALGITGALTLLAMIFGVVLAAVLFWLRIAGGVETRHRERKRVKT